MIKATLAKFEKFFKNDSRYMKFLTALIVILNSSSLYLLFHGELGIQGLVLWIFCNTLYILDAILVHRDSYEHKAIDVSKFLYDESSKLYLCGFSLDEYVESNAFERFAKWIGNGFCWVTATTGMFILRGNYTARICKGHCFREDGSSLTHYWVEFSAEKEQWVLDLSWVGGFIPRKLFYKHAKPDLKWSCSYDEFWNIEAVNELYEKMRRLETSYVFDILVGYFFNYDPNQGFVDDIHNVKIRQDTSKWSMIPIPNEDRTKTCWNETLRDFVKNPKRMQPKARTQRIAWRAWRYFKQAIRRHQSSTKAPI